MRGRTFFLLGMSLGLCAVPFTCRRTERYCSSRSLVPVVVAAVDLPEGTVVTYDMISQRAAPEQFVTSSVIKPDSASYVINQRILVPVQAGDALRWVDFANKRVELQPGERVVTLELEPSRALPGLLARRDHVDVLTTVTDPDTQQRVAQTLLENAQVLEVTGRTLTAVKLVVDGEAAEKLLLMQDAGKLALTLRNPGDLGTAGLGRRTTLESVLRPRSGSCTSRPLALIRGPAK